MNSGLLAANKDQFSEAQCDMLTINQCEFTSRCVRGSEVKQAALLVQPLPYVLLMNEACTTHTVSMKHPLDQNPCTCWSKEAEGERPCEREHRSLTYTLYELYFNDKTFQMSPLWER